ncbi:HAD-like domain-containing protein [Lasiosphaeria miniovina]|uniref:HAD-like domain-containing protein n=1 Tax=Lasiosphaeria miniovina TaxID=1954250 RepID=A0AA40B677_9PEZI|nr:HAD-like domain-containing protein [Lasiosphaeria miniovina]KAK0728456.1 HAD-like domain-containing protein [Lasiosphaeria miniovina]
MSSASLASQIKGLTFDVFGTVVDCRTPVTKALVEAAAAKIASPASGSLPPDIQARVRALTKDDWAAFTQEWLYSYGKFTHSFVPGVTEWKDIDTHHYDSFIELLDKWQLPGLYTPDEMKQLNKIWHALEPWPDSSEGIHKLGTRFKVSTLSNGNRSLLADLNEHGNLGFQYLASAEDFKAYKPNPATYLGACRQLGLEPSEVAMVAAHLGDLASARALGLRTIYVERRHEEDWKPDEERYREAKEWVDLWIKEDEDGFKEVAERLGI